MSFKCSLLGHKFGETAVERDRQEDGTEVVITITELETCTRCGETRVVSENKEVTTLETPATGDAGAEGTADVPGPDAGSADARDAAVVDAEGGDDSDPTIPDAESDTVSEPTDDAVIIDDAEEDDDERDPGEWPEEADDEDGATPADAPASEADADGDDDDERDPGEWPDDSDVTAAERAGESAEVEILESESAEETGTDDSASGSTEAGSGVETGVDDAGAAAADERAEATVGGPTNAGAVTADGDASGASSESGSAGGVGGQGTSAWPDERDEGALSADEAMGEWPEETKRDEPADSGLVNTELDDDEEAITVPEGMFKCSECGFTTEVESSSLRAGDFCPECHRGTLAQHGDGDDA